MWHLLLCCAPFAAVQDPVATPSGREPAVEDVGAALDVIGLGFDDEELELMVPDVLENLRSFERMRGIALANSVPPALRFEPLSPLRAGDAVSSLLVLPAAPLERPADLGELIWADVPTLAGLIKSRKVTCVEVTKTYLQRLHAIDPELHCVVTFLDERALARAMALDAELDEGRWRGLLHGVPWGAKDLIAVAGAPTTWGTEPFREQRFDADATVAKKLEEAGAVLIAKLSLGELAWGDVWYGGRTRNPWNLEQGSSGSSAGPCAATAAGGVAFAIGSETLGSIVSPSDRCGTSSLRPSFGRVSRHGSMTLAWSMDKLGPICRTVQDAAIVFAAVQGPDGWDPTVRAAGFSFPTQPNVDPPHKWRVGLLDGSFAASAGVVQELKALDATDPDLEIEWVPVKLPDFPVDAMTIVLSAEAAAAFDEFSVSSDVDRMARQERRAWPNVFRAARLVPAVEYLRANRLRTLLMQELDAVLAQVDVLVHPSFAEGLLSMTNLTGHPVVVAPAGFREDGTPFSVSFTGPIDGEGRLLTFAHLWQRSTVHHLRHPER